MKLSVTRQRILSLAITVFNQQGFYTPTIADLAKAAGMSRGNFAYHYKFKKDILTDVALMMTTDIEQAQKSRRDYPAFSNLSLDIRTCGALQAKYPFVFRDMSVLEHHEIKTVLTNWSSQTIQQNLEAFGFAIEVGNMQQEIYPGIYKELAINAWLITYYWVAQNAVRTIKKTETAERMVWSTIYPHFTAKGKQAFVAYYGTDFFTKNGTPIKTLTNQKGFF